MIRYILSQYSHTDSISYSDSKYLPTDSYFRIQIQTLNLPIFISEVRLYYSKSEYIKPNFHKNHYPSLTNLYIYLILQFLF